MNEPLISVLIVNCNHEDTLGATIASVLGQTWKNLELVVVDDGSTDGSCAVVESFMDDPRVHLHRLPKTSTFAAPPTWDFPWCVATGWPASTATTSGSPSA